MAYSSTNPPALVSQRIGGGPALWIYKSSDESSVSVTATKYFANGEALGMRVGDLVFSISTTAGTSALFTICAISSISSTGSAGAGSTDIVYNSTE
jgi:hypothetical protein